MSRNICFAHSRAGLPYSNLRPATHTSPADPSFNRSARGSLFRHVQDDLGYAELGYHEEKSSALLQHELQLAGFKVKTGVADEPTAFVASYGHGAPVIGIFGEFDAVPGLSQAAMPDRNPVVDGAPGRGCGHNLLGSGAGLAAVALKEYIDRSSIAGTLRFYGTPAEEGADGKVYMIQAGLGSHPEGRSRRGLDDRNDT